MLCHSKLSMDKISFCSLATIMNTNRNTTQLIKIFTMTSSSKWSFLIQSLICGVFIWKNDNFVSNVHAWKTESQHQFSNNESQQRSQKKRNRLSCTKTLEEVDANLHGWKIQMGLSKALITFVLVGRHETLCVKAMHNQGLLCGVKAVIVIRH